MSEMWEFVGQIPPGGTVVSITGGEHGRVWVAAPAGLFCRVGGQWAAAVRGMPFTQITALLSAGSALLAAGSSGAEPGLVRTVDSGASWAHAWIDQVETPITCLAASPNFHRDQTALAGTYGEGVLRTTDGGRYWHLSNFGLQDFVVLAVSAAPDWQRRETAFLATESGVYRSPNGGRAWKQCSAGPANVIVQALAVHPNGTVFAGTEADGLFVSTDNGASWRSGGGPQSINSLYLAPQPGGAHALFAAAADGVFRADDGGAAWQQLDRREAAALAIGAADGALFAGWHAAGLTESFDQGASWARPAGFSARRLNWLGASSPVALFAAGQNDGVWRSADGGRSWTAAGWPEDTVIYDFAAAAFGGRPLALAASSAGLLRAHGAGAKWESVLPPGDAPDTALTALACSPDFPDDGHAWAGNTTGMLWASADGGVTWSEMATPFDGKAVMAIAPSGQYASDGTLLVAAADPAARRLQLWHSPDDGTTWQLWLDEFSEWLAPRIAPSGSKGSETALTLGTEYLYRSQHGWQRTEITTREAPAIRLLAQPESPVRFVLTAAGLLVSREESGKRWKVFDDGLQDAAPTDVIILPGVAGKELLLALTVDGKIWRRPLG